MSVMHRRSGEAAMTQPVDAPGLPLGSTENCPTIGTKGAPAFAVQTPETRVKSAISIEPSQVLKKDDAS
jgi:hypothetical protein